MNYYLKYLKYKSKYINLLNKQKGGGLTIMPQLCFGTAQMNLQETLPKALELGYRHIDCASNYGGDEYKNTIKDAIKIIPRDKLWITWKFDGISIEHIQEIIRKLECGYIDLLLIHHGCGSDSDYIFFKKAQEMGLIRFYGVSNCEDIDRIRDLKTKHCIYANQVQARPPHGKISEGYLYRTADFQQFVSDCYEIDVKIMLYASISGVVESDDRPRDMSLDNVNKYYIQKYIKNTLNVLIVASQTGWHLEHNLIDINNIIKDNLILPELEITEIEDNLTKITLRNMG
jgi:diketogulonate reductase-like aldo/keto reductase